jgi:hypothetical protein
LVNKQRGRERASQRTSVGDAKGDAGRNARGDLI